MAEESGPRPGHFLPSDDRASDDRASDDQASVGQASVGHAGDGHATARPTYERPRVPAYGAPSEPLAAPTPRLGRGAQIDDGPPLLSGSRLGPPPPGDRAAAAFKARYHPEPLPFDPKKRSKLLTTAVIALALIVIAGAVLAATRLL